MSDYVYSKTIETHREPWANCSHCMRMADLFCKKCDAHWCHACLKSYHGYWKKSGKSEVFVKTAWTHVFHDPDSRYARKAEKAAWAHYKKLVESYSRKSRNIDSEPPLHRNELPCHTRIQKPIKETLKTPTTNSSAKRKRTPAATASSAAGVTSQESRSESVTTAVTFV